MFEVHVDAISESTVSAAQSFFNSHLYNSNYTRDASVALLILHCGIHSSVVHIFILVQYTFYNAS